MLYILQKEVSMNYYIYFVKQHTILNECIQFAILGTLGEIIAYYIRGRRGFPFKFNILIFKMLS